MSCHGNNATPPSPAIAPGAEGIDAGAAAAELGRRWPGGVDPRLRAVLPAFDAPFVQAGLAGYSDAPMRIIARRHGCPLCVTEALLDRMLLGGGHGFDKADLELIRDNIPGGHEDQPLVGQIIGSDPDEMAAAALKMIEQAARHDRAYRDMAYGEGRLPEYVDTRWRCTPQTEPLTTEHTGTTERAAETAELQKGRTGRWTPASTASATVDHRAETASRPTMLVDAVRGAGDPSGSMAASTFAAIDVNLACPVKKIDRKARGGHWLTEPDGATQILRAVRAAVPPEIPCTVKLRRGYDDTAEMAASFERIFDAALELGYAWATVHARTVEQKYIGPSRWTFLRDLVARRPDALVLGSGDVWDVGEIFRMIGYTGVAAVSVARGCIGNPWIFRQARQMLAGEKPAAPTIDEQREVLLEHFGLCVALHGERAAGKMMRKFGIRFASHHPEPDAVRTRMIAVNSTADWREVVGEFYALTPSRRGEEAASAYST